MKKSIYYLAAALIAASAISCNKEQDKSAPFIVDAEEEGVVYVQMMELNLNASTGEPSTRTVFEKDGNGLKTKWLATDKIGVVIPATVTTTVSSQAGSTTSQSYMGFPLSSPTLYGDDDRTAIFDGLIPGYMKVTQTPNGVKTVTETTLTAGSVLAFYPSLTPSNVSAVISSTGTTTTTIQYLNLNKTYSIGEQTGELKDLGEYAVMTSTGTLGISLQTSNGQRIQVGSITDAMQFTQKVAVLHIDHMWLGLADDLDLSQGLTLTFSGAGIGKSFAINSSTGQMTTTAGSIVVTLTGDDVYEVQETDWDEEKGRYVLPEDCGKVILWDPSEADMDGGTYYLEDLYIAFIPKNFQAGAELSLTATGTGYGADFQGEYLWSARTAYQAGKVYHLRDKMMNASKLLPSGSMLLYYDESEGYKQLDGKEFKWDTEYSLYVGDSENPTNVLTGLEIPFWSSSNAQVARVENGKLICSTVGTAEITAKDKNGNTVSAQVTVAKHKFSSGDYLTADVPSEDDIYLGDNGKPAAIVFAGESLQLRVKRGDEILDPSHFTWSVGSGGTAMVSVNENGLVTRQTSGEATIVVKDYEGTSRSIIVAPQDNISLVFCDEEDRKLGNYQFTNGLALSKKAYGYWFATLYVRAADGDAKYKTESTLSSTVNYLTMEKINDDRGSVEFGTVKLYGTYSPTYPPYHNVFYSQGDEAAASVYKVTYNGPYGKVSLPYMYVLHDKIDVTMDFLTFEQGCLDPEGGQLPIQIRATSSFFLPIEWNMLSPSWSDYDPGQSPLVDHDGPWTTQSGETFTLNAQIPMKKTKEVHEVSVVLLATTAGNRGGTSENFSLWPTIKSATIDAIPVKHDSVTEDIDLSEYVEWGTSYHLRLGAGCGFVPNASSARTKVGAELKLRYKQRDRDAWFNLATSPLFSHITVTTSCSDGYYFNADAFYHFNSISEVIYATKVPPSNSVVYGRIDITDGLGNNKNLTVIICPDTIHTSF